MSTCKPRAYSEPQKEKITKQIVDMLDRGIITEAQSHFASPVCLVRKSDSTWRFCIDYRKMNKNIMIESFPLPRIEDLLHQLHGMTHFITLDLASGYWQLPLHENTKPITAFMTHDNVYQFNVLPFGFNCAPVIFQRTMMDLFRDVPGLLIYLVDILIMGKSTDEAVGRLQQVLDICHKRNITLKYTKCKFLTSELRYLGYIITAEGYKVDEKKVTDLRHFPIPQNKDEVRRTLFGYYRIFIEKFAEISSPIAALLKIREKFEWTSEHTRCFEELKNRLCTHTMNSFFDPNQKAVVDTDASKTAVGAVLHQKRNNTLSPILFISRKLSEVEQNWAAREIKAFAVVWAVQRLRKFLLGRRFEVRTKHASLQWLKSSEQGKLIRWSIILAEFDFAITYNKGSEMQHVDCISRMTPPDTFEQALAKKMEVELNPIKTQNVDDPNLNIRQRQENDVDLTNFRTKVKEY